MSQMVGTTFALSIVVRRLYQPQDPRNNLERKKKVCDMPRLKGGVPAKGAPFFLFCYLPYLSGAELYSYLVC